MIGTNFSVTVAIRFTPPSKIIPVITATPIPITQAGMPNAFSVTICETAIGKLEKAIAALDAEMEQYACDAVKLGELFQQKQETEELLEQEMLRWEELSLVLEENEV